MEIHQEYAHASKLAVLIKEMMNITGSKLDKISAVAVSAGPGSYTGLRIGTSLAKGLCYALDVPLVSVPTLHVLAAQVKAISISDAFLCPMIDARRMEVYCQLFDFSLEELESVKALVVDERSFENYLKIKPVIFFGNGAMKCSQVIIHENAKFLSDVCPSAVQLGEHASKKFQQGHLEDLVHFVPHYLKEFFTKRHLGA
jgi:tRNA threonylcarbamoyladenosine biosynthesis protein TsaB